MDERPYPDGGDEGDLLGISSTGYAVFYLLTAITILVFLYGVYRRFARYAEGDDDPFARVDELPRRIVTASKIVLSNEKQFDRDLYGGLMHAFILWGFLTLLIATLIIGFEQYATEMLLDLSFWQGDFYLAYQFVVDAMGLLFVVGIGMAIYRRYWVRNRRLWGRHTSSEDDIFIWTLFGLGVGGFLLEGLRIYATGMPDHEVVSFVGYGLAMMFQALSIPLAGEPGSASRPASSLAKISTGLPGGHTPCSRSSSSPGSPTPSRST